MVMGNCSSLEKLLQVKLSKRATFGLGHRWSRHESVFGDRQRDFEVHVRECARL